LSNLDQFLKQYKLQLDSGPKKTGGYIDPQERWSKEFNKLLMNTIEETIQYVMGETNASIIFQHIQENYCAKEDIPNNLKSLSYALRDLIGPSRTQMKGAAFILEETIAEAVVIKIGKKFVIERPLDFPNYILDIRQRYIRENRLR